MKSLAPHGFTLIELLIVMVVLSIVMAIAIPSLLNVFDRGRQKRTMADVRILGGSIEAYSVDQGYYPAGSDMTALEVLVPEYVDAVIVTDAWGHQLIYNATAARYTLGSAGRDGGNSLALEGDGGPTDRFENDIIYSLGQFLQWPEGTQN